MAVLLFKISEQRTINIVNNVDAWTLSTGGDAACWVPSSDGTIDTLGKLSCSGRSTSCKIRQPSLDFCQHSIVVQCNEFLDLFR